MCDVDWILLASILSGVGTLLIGLSTMLTLCIQFGYKTKAKSLESSLKLMLVHYKKYISSEQGILWREYPKDASQTINGIAEETGLNIKLVKNLLDSLKADRKI